MTSKFVISERPRNDSDLVVILAQALTRINRANSPDDIIRTTLGALRQITDATAVAFSEPALSSGEPARLIQIPAAHVTAERAGSGLSFLVPDAVLDTRICVYLASDQALDPSLEIAVNLLISSLGPALRRAGQDIVNQHTEFVAAANELSATLLSHTNQDDVRQRSVEWAGKRLNADHCLIVSCDPDPAVFRNVQPRTHLWSGSSNSVPPGPEDIVALRSIDEHALVMSFPIHSVPRVELILTRDDGRRPWSLNERERARRLSTVIEQHLIRARNRQDVQQRPHTLQAVQQIASAASGASHLTELYSLMHDAVDELILHDAFLIALRPPGNDIVTMVYRSEGDETFPPRTALPWVVQALDLGRPAVIDDIILDVESPDERFGDPEKHVRSAVNAPMLSEGSPIGLLLVQSYEPRSYNWDAAELLQSIAMSVTGALERLLLLEQLERQTQRDVGLRSVAERLGNTLDTDTLIATASDVIYDTIKSDLVMTLIVDLNSDQVRSGSYRSLKPDFDTPPPGYSLRHQSLSFTAIHRGEQLVEQDYARSGYANPNNVPWSHSGAAVATPIPIDGQHAGVIVLARDESNAFPPDDLSLIRQIAAMLSTSLQNSYAHAERLRNANDLIELHRLSSTIAAQLDLQKSLDAIVHAAPRLVDADSCVVGMLDGTDMLRVAAYGSLATTIPQRVPLKALLVEELTRSTVPVVLPDARAVEHERQAGPLSIPDTRGWLAMALKDANGEPVGVICLMADERREWSDRERSLLATLANTGALAIQNARHFERTRDLLTASVESLAAAVEAKDPYTQNHSRQVAVYGRRIAEALGLDRETVGHIELAGLLHDVGKIGIPDSVLEKPGPLDGAGWAAMQLHPVIGEQILAGNPILNPLLSMVRHHHERWDGHGYPDRLGGEDIPVGASIISLAEALDTMTSERPYRSASGWDESLAEIRSSSGSQFAPHVVAALTRSIESGAFDDEIHRLVTVTSAGDREPQPRSQPLDMRALRIFEEVAQEIRAGTGLASLISRIVHTLNDVMEISFAALFLVDEDDGDLVLTKMLSNTSGRMQHNGRIPIGTGIVGWVAEHGVIQNIPDVQEDPRFIGFAISQPTRSELAVPLIAEGNVIGVLNLESDLPGAFSDMDERLLESTTGHVANAIHVIRLHERLKKLATSDALTGLDNHRALFDHLVQEVAHAAEQEGEVSIAILDVNNLKAVNDTYGHLTGDAALRAMAEVLNLHRREGDVISRYGGDEFALILPGASSEDAWELLRQISADLHIGEFEIDDVTFPLPTASWGIATFPHDGLRPTELLEVADARMYQQKQTTRL